MDKLDKIVKEAIIKQLDMFGGEPEVIKKKRKKMSDWEKQKRAEERKEKKEMEKKSKQQKDFEDYWEKRGWIQGKLFDDDGNVVDESIKMVVREEINKLIKEDSGINIKPENKGKFTATKKRTGKSTSELLHSKNKKTRARANFARMAKRGWKPLKK